MNSKQPTCYPQPVPEAKPFMRMEHLIGYLRRGAVKRFMTGTFAGIWAVTMLGFAGYVLHFNSATVGILFLLIVVSVAILSGFWEATIVSILACACLDYFFYPPVLVFTINDPQDWVALGTFEISALVVSRLSSKEQRVAVVARTQQAAMEQ